MARIRFLFVTLVILAGAAFAATPALATSQTVTCDTLQAALTGPTPRAGT